MENELEHLRQKVAEQEKLINILEKNHSQGDEAIALRQSEEKYRMLVENSLQGLAIIQDGHYVFCNKAFASISGYSLEELLSFSPAEMGAMLHPDDRDVMRKRYEDRLAGKPVSPHYEFRGIKKDGTEYWLESYASLIKYNGREAIQLAHIDITERKQAERSLRESEERFRLITETIDEIFWIFDLNQNAPTYISPSHERIWGYPVENHTSYYYQSRDYATMILHRLTALSRPSNG